MTNRPNFGPWQPFGNGARAYSRNPYAEMEVLPTESGWRWSVQRIVPNTGAFSLVADGVERLRRDAEQCAMDCAKNLRYARLGCASTFPTP